VPQLDRVPELDYRCAFMVKQDSHSP